MRNPSTTAILIFSRTAIEEARVKKYARYVGEYAGVKLAHKSIQHTIKEASNTGLPTYILFTGKQHGNNFGEKLANSLEDVFVLGYKEAIILGSDCPSISSDLLKRVSLSFKENDLVLGPAQDGGVYVIGIKKTAYKRDAFINIPWLSSNVLDAFLEFGEATDCNVCMEATEQDTDNISALYDWIQANSNKALAKVFACIVSLPAVIREFTLNSSIPATLHLLRLLFRGPPSPGFS